MKVERFLKNRTLFLLVPLVIAIVWTCLHPIVSIITGELKCRGYYIDENALDPSSFRYDKVMFSSPSSWNSNNNIKDVSSMCDVLMNRVTTNNVECHRERIQQKDGEYYLEVAQLVPISNAITPVAESIVLVVPGGVDWTKDLFSNTILQYYIRLSNAQSTPWLAKTVLLVSSSKNKNKNNNLSQTVNTFLDYYNGSNGHREKRLILPAKYRSSMIRQLLVLDVGTNSKEDDKLLLLPQGTYGLLPNMDLVLLVMVIYSGSNFIYLRQNSPISNPFRFGIHPYTSASTTLSNFDWYKNSENTKDKTTHQLRQWLHDLLDMLRFCQTLAVGDDLPHSKALIQGIDSMTIRLRISSKNKNNRQYIIHEFLQRFEGIVRGLSNIHERLHHSLTQYLLPTPYKFVSQSEYVIPSVLALSPLLIRAVSLLLFEMNTTFDIKAFQPLFLVAVLTVILQIVIDNTGAAATNRYNNNNDTTTSEVHTIMAIGYSILLSLYLIPSPSSKHNEKKKSSFVASFHFLTCLSGIYLLAPLVIGHMTLGYPSALLWSVLVAIIPRSSNLLMNTILWPVLLFVTSPPVILVPKLFNGSYDHPYITMIYLPLHLMIVLLWLLGFVFQNKNNNKKQEKEKTS